ncbi:hypothetical protein GGI19_004593 [Coemansia pectinata]|uniref:Uncharacterized protein n=1 Tax=Coemansia pectinata TaxID=1052879 RepID=A0A9W8LA62_9FUNG|nr:hypothetical protein GGI19_004593 [Coemansia pectinata]
MLFRGDGATLQYLHLPFSAIARNGLGRFNVLKRSGVTNMSCISIDFVSSSDNGFMLSHRDLHIRQQMHRALQVASKVVTSSNTASSHMFNAALSVPGVANLQHLSLGGLSRSVDNIIELLVALPSLVSLSCGISELRAVLKVIPASERPSRFHAKYYPLSRNFRTLCVPYSADISTELVAYTAMLIAVLCPNFVQVDISNGLRKEFSREIAWASVNDIFKPYADDINRLIYKEQNY